MWPFSTAQLTAGLRRYFADPTLHVKAFHDSTRPIVPGETQGAVRGLRIDYAATGGTASIDTIVKQPRGTTRRGLAGTGVREAGLYRTLSALVPVTTPALIAADPAGTWLVLEAVESDVVPAAWGREDYLEAVRLLAATHERFWGLAEDLSVFDWLSRALSTDFDIYVLSAVNAVERMVAEDRPRVITGSLDVLNTLGLLLTQVERVAERLRGVPATLLHGDYRPSNVALVDGDQVAFGWGLAAVGPGLLDLCTFVDNCRWDQPVLPLEIDEIWSTYRAEMQARVGITWTDADFEELIDYARMWRLIQDLLESAASASPALFDPVAGRFDALFLQPALDAVQRRLRPALYL